MTVELSVQIKFVYVASQKFLQGIIVLQLQYVNSYIYRHTWISGRICRLRIYSYNYCQHMELYNFQLCNFIICTEQCCCSNELFAERFVCWFVSLFLSFSLSIFHAAKLCERRGVRQNDVSGNKMYYTHTYNIYIHT